MLWYLICMQKTSPNIWEGYSAEFIQKGLSFVTLRLGGDTTTGMLTKTLQRELLGLGKNIELLVRKFV